MLDAVLFVERVTSDELDEKETRQYRQPAQPQTNYDRRSSCCSRKLLHLRPSHLPCHSLWLEAVPSTKKRRSLRTELCYCTVLVITRWHPFIPLCTQHFAESDRHAWFLGGRIGASEFCPNAQARLPVFFAHTCSRNNPKKAKAVTKTGKPVVNYIRPYVFSYIIHQLNHSNN